MPRKPWAERAKTVGYLPILKASASRPSAAPALVSQGDVAKLKGEEVDWTNSTVSFVPENQGAGPRPPGAEALNAVIIEVAVWWWRCRRGMKSNCQSNALVTDPVQISNRAASGLCFRSLTESANEPFRRHVDCSCLSCRAPIPATSSMAAILSPTSASFLAHCPKAGRMA